jgi:3-hydroxyacyl-[acyl-carrier-protein] dehydratase
MSDKDAFVTSLSVSEIKKLIPHRYPMLLIDKVVDIDPETVSGTGIKSVTINEEFFQGHFPERPIMPGVLTIEAMAQTAAVVRMHISPEAAGQLVYFLGIESAKFRRPVEPGDQLHMHVSLLRQRGPISRFKGVAKVDGKIVAEAELTAMTTDNN